MFALSALVACDGGAPPIPHRSTPSADTSATPPTPGPVTPTGIVRLSGITVLADLSEPIVRWQPSTFIPFGDADDAVGALLKKSVASIPIVPPSFAVGRDGSVWLIDLVKRRVVHYGPDGRFLGAVGGLEFDRFSPYPQDLGFFGGRLELIEHVHGTLQSNLRSIGARIGPRRRVHVAWEQLVVGRLIAPQTEILGRVTGTAGSDGSPVPGGGTVGDFRIDPATGSARRTDGIQLEDGTALTVLPRLIREGQALAIRHVSGSDVTHRMLDVRVVPGGGDEARLPAEAAWETDCALPHGFASFVRLSPSRLTDATRYGGGQWLLEYFDDGEPLVWERLPDSPLDAAEIYRHIAVGLDGHTYLMVAERDGMRIYRRPGPAVT